MRLWIKSGRTVKEGTLVLLMGMILVVSLSAGGKKEGPTKAAQVETAKPVIAVSILPHSYFVRRIGGEFVTVMTLVGPGQSPHTYEPTPRQMEELSKAQVWILSGTDFEDRIKPRVASLYPNLKIVDGTDGVKFRNIEAHEHDEETHGDKSKDAHKHEHEQKEKEEHKHEMERDRHTWLGREPAKIFSAHVRDALIQLIPPKAEEVRRNHDSLVREIDAVFEGLKKELAPLNGKTVYVYHPAFGYFFDEFGIVQEAVETGGKEPNPQALSVLIAKAKKDKVKAIFVQAQFPTQAAQTLARELKAEVVPLNPLAEDWMENIKKMGEALKKAAH